MSRGKFQREDQEEPANLSKTDMYRGHLTKTNMKNQMFSLSLVYWFFYYLRSDSQQSTNKARYDAICVQDMSEF